MCGIAGIVGTATDPQIIETMTRRLVHRGPDHQQIWRAPGVQLGHTRLAILDLSPAGNQPMHLDQLTLTYNGEIYNFRELRRQLVGPFRSDGDSEVLLHLYAQHGARCVDLLRGMFAFAIWDAKENRLFAARDRLGIKPLFYRELPDGLAFASELKALLDLGQPPIDRTALRDYFTYKYIPDPKTVYSGIHKLPPGHTLTWDGNLRIERYWSPSAAVQIADFEEAVPRLDELLREIIPAHTVADVPVAVFLSGGIDSTTVVAHLDRPRTITLGTDITRRDESPTARRVAAHFGTEHHEETASSVDLGEALEVAPGLFDEPFGDTGAWATFMVSRIARRHATVALTGEGGDELFCGYHWYSKWAAGRSTSLHRALVRLLPPFSRASRSSQRRASAGLDRYAAFLSPFTALQREHLLGPALAAGDYDDLWHFRRHWREDLEPLKRMQWADLHTYLPGDLLTKVDRASMAHSLEIRPPFLDHELVEFALSLDTRLLRDVEGRRGKLIVRRLMNGRVPDGLFDRPKRGFNLPMGSWVQRRSELLRGALDRLSQADIIRPTTTTRFTNEQTWTLLFLDRWLQQSGATW
jgi:asparagine synthase (glutamine-hydrolysing)